MQLCVESIKYILIYAITYFSLLKSLIYLQIITSFNYESLIHLHKITQQKDLLTGPFSLATIFQLHDAFIS